MAVIVIVIVIVMVMVIVIRLMDKILHDPKDPKLWEIWYIPYYGSCRILSISRSNRNSNSNLDGASGAYEKPSH